MLSPVDSILICAGGLTVNSVNFGCPTCKYTFYLSVTFVGSPHHGWLAWPWARPTHVISGPLGSHG